MKNTEQIYWSSRPMLNRNTKQYPALAPSYVQIDERSIADHLAYLKEYARNLIFYNLENQESGNWEALLSQNTTVALSVILHTDLDEIDRIYRQTLAEVSFKTDKLTEGYDEKVYENVILRMFNVIYDLAERINNWKLLADKAYPHHKDYQYSISEKINHFVERELFPALWDLEEIIKLLPKSPKVLNLQEKFTERIYSWKRFRDFKKNIKNEEQEFQSIKLKHLKKQTNLDAGQDLKLCVIQLGILYQIIRDGIKYILDKSIIELKSTLEQKSNHSPEMGLLITFLELMQIPQNELNKTTKKHLDYYYRTILRMSERTAKSDSVVVFTQLNKNITEYNLKAKSLITGIQEANSNVPVYEIKYDVPLSKAQVTALESVFVSKTAKQEQQGHTQFVSGIHQSSIPYQVPALKAIHTKEEIDTNRLNENQKVRSIGHRPVQSSEIGLVIGSPILLLSEGKRTINISFHFQEYTIWKLNKLIDDDSSSNTKRRMLEHLLRNGFKIALSTEQGWVYTDFGIDEKQINRIIEETEKKRPSVNEIPCITYTIDLEKTFPAVTTAPTDLIPEQAGNKFPLIKFVLNSEISDYAYTYFEVLRFLKIAIDVKVEGLQQFQLFNMDGNIEDSQPFQMFGATPQQGDYFLFSNDELYKKQLTALDIKLHWYQLPKVDFGTYYKAYNEFLPEGQEYTNEAFKVSIATLNNHEFTTLKEGDKEILFPLFDASSEIIEEDSNSASDDVFDEETEQGFDEERDDISDEFMVGSGDNTSKKLYNTTSFENLDISSITPDYELQPISAYDKKTSHGLVKIELKTPAGGFGHNEFPAVNTKISQDNALILSNYAVEKAKSINSEIAKPELKDLPNPPFIPKLKGISANYKAETTISFNSWSENQKNPYNYVGHIHPYGYQTIFNPKEIFHYHFLPTYIIHQNDANDTQKVHYENAYLYIGLEDLDPPQKISIYFRLEDTITTLQNRSARKLSWSFLADNEWLNLSQENILRDGTKGFARSSNIVISIPENITDNNTIMPSGKYWLRVNVLGDSTFMQYQLGARTNGFTAKRHHPEHQEVRSLPPHHLNKMKDKIPQVGKIEQPYASYGGYATETEEQFYMRTSERLRHKERAVTYWDYERIVLDHFDEIQQVKCLRSQTEDGGQLITVIVMPKILNTKYHSQPRTSSYMIGLIQKHLESVASPFAKIKVRNPDYQVVQISAKVKFKTSNNDGDYIEQLTNELNAYLSPYTNLDNSTISLGLSTNDEKITQFIEQKPYVIEVTALNLFEQLSNEQLDTETTQNNTETEIIPDVNTIKPRYPWSIIVPAEEHFITIDDDFTSSTSTVDTKSVGIDMIVEPSKIKLKNKEEDEETKTKESLENSENTNVLSDIDIDLNIEIKTYNMILDFDRLNNANKVEEESPVDS